MSDSAGGGDGFDRLEARMQDAARGLDSAERAAARLADTAGTGLRRSLEQAVFGGAKLSDSLRGLARDFARNAFRQAVSPLGDAVGSAASRALSGAIGALAGGATPFARGGVVENAQLFSARGGMGLMGEAGPEAVMPLARGPDGRLGVRAGGGAAPVQITMNVATPDAQSFNRSRSQIAASLARMVAQGQRRM